jgi:hypothetical protein
VVGVVFVLGFEDAIEARFRRRRGGLARAYVVVKRLAGF